jgi:D-glycero-D-manno-heptose 1,7-bisphosphate phosphatase
MHPRAVFLDKDGTLVEDVPFNVDPEKVRLLPGAGEGLRLLRDAGFAFVVVSNQSGVARGYFAEEALAEVERRVRGLLETEGILLARFCWCPHYPAGAVAAYARACACRKPEPGMLLRAAQELSIDLAGSWMIGDRAEDVEAGRRAGCRTVWIADEARRPNGDNRPCADHTAGNLLEAARLILAGQGR